MYFEYRLFVICEFYFNRVNKKNIILWLGREYIKDEENVLRL